MKNFKGVLISMAKARRLLRGACPVHGLRLAQGMPIWENGAPVAEWVSCPRNDCDFKTEVRPGTKLWKAIREG